jgi:hypothetical protein
MTPLELFKPTAVRDADGDVCNCYAESSALSFIGNVQPFGEKENPREYGIDPQYAYVIYTYTNAEFLELDQVRDAGGNWYEIKLIQRWGAYCRLLTRSVTNDERRV